MKAFAQYLKRQSPAPQLADFGHGWIELPNGQRWQPSASRVVFLGGPLHQVNRPSAALGGSV